MRSIILLCTIAGCSFEGSGTTRTDATPGHDVGSVPPDAPLEASSDATTCSGFVALAGGNPGSTYAALGTVKWFAAEAACEGFGAHLVILDDDAELAAIAAFNATELWVGLTDLETPRVWRDVTGTVSTYALPAGGPPWKGNEPSAGAKDHAVSLHTSALDAKNPDEAHLAMCECDHKTIDPTSFPVPQ